MLTVGRRFIVAFLAVALSSQLVQGQLLRCGWMDMSVTAGMMRESMQRSAHQRNDARVAPAPNSPQIVDHRDDGAQTQEPASSICILKQLCMNASAVPAVFQPSFSAGSDSAAIASGTMPPAAWALRPESPPPRL